MGALQSVPIDASCCACGGLEHKLPAGRIELDPVPEKPSSARSTRGRHALQSRISSEKYAFEQKTQQPSRPSACENDDVRLPTLMTSSFLCDPMQAAVCMTMPACDVTEPLARRTSLVFPSLWQLDRSDCRLSWHVGYYTGSFDGQSQEQAG